MIIKSTIKSYVSRYVVPFCFDSKNGYAKILSYFRGSESISTFHQMGLPKDTTCEERGFWENYKSNKPHQREMDIYTYLLSLLKENNKEIDTNLGVSFVLNSNGQIIKLTYSTKDSNEKQQFINFYCTNIGVLIFRNGIGFVWYDIKFNNFNNNLVNNTDMYTSFQNDFKELARTKDKKFVKTNKENNNESENCFCMGEFLSQLINADKLGIKFWAERKISSHTNISTSPTTCVPDKALLYQYIFIENADQTCRSKVAFWLANGYDNKYNPPSNLKEIVYEPFGNSCFYITKSGMANVVSNDNSNDDFFIDNHPSKYISDYFFIYILLLYQTFSCAHFSMQLSNLPAEIRSFSMNKKSLKFLETIDDEINLFLVKSIYESVSNIHHQNGVYNYGKKALCVEEDINSLTIGMDALRGFEKQKEQEKKENRDKAINRRLSILGVLSVISALFDAFCLIDYLIQPIDYLNIIAKVVAVIFIVIIFLHFLWSWFKK